MHKCKIANNSKLAPIRHWDEADLQVVIMVFHNAGSLAQKFIPVNSCFANHLIIAIMVCIG